MKATSFLTNPIWRLVWKEKSRFKTEFVKFVQNTDICLEWMVYFLSIFYRGNGNSYVCIAVHLHTTVCFEIFSGRKFEYGYKSSMSDNDMRTISSHEVPTNTRSLYHHNPARLKVKIWNLVIKLNIDYIISLTANPSTFELWAQFQKNNKIK